MVPDGIDLFDEYENELRMIEKPSRAALSGITVYLFTFTAIWMDGFIIVQYVVTGLMNLSDLTSMSKDFLVVEGVREETCWRANEHYCGSK